MPLNTETTQFTERAVPESHQQHAAVSATPPAVVAELDDVVLIAVPLGVHDEAEEGLLLLPPVDHHSPSEEPVPAVLAGTQRDTKKLNQTRNWARQAAQLVTPLHSTPHLLDWARSKHSTLVGFLLILWNIDV